MVRNNKENKEKKLKQKNEQTEQKNGLKKVLSSPVSRTVMGGAIGAGIGYVLKPGSDKQVLSTKKPAKKDLKKQKRKGYCQVAKFKLNGIKDSGIEAVEGAADTIKGKVTGNDKKVDKKKKRKEKLKNKKKKANKNKGKSPYQALKFENEALQERLKNLENKITQYGKSKNK